MASVRINMRMPEDLWSRVGDLALRLDRDRTAVVRAALESYLDDAQRGVPDVPKPVGVQQAVERQVARRPLPPGVGRGKPARESFASGEDWQRAVRVWREESGS